MELVIGGKVYQLTFGIEFIRQVDNRYDKQLEVAGDMEFGLGLVYIISPLSLGTPVAMSDVIQCATAHYVQKPSKADIEEYLLNLEDEEYNKLRDDFLEQFNQSKAITKTLDMIGRMAEQANTNKEKQEQEKAKAVEKHTED